MPAEVRRQYQKPGNEISLSDFAAERAKEISIADAAIGSENGLPDEEDQDRHDDQTEEKQSDEYRELFAGKLPEFGRYCCGIH